MTDLTAQQASAWSVVQTDADPVTLATVGALQARAAQLHDWATKTAASAQSLRTQAEQQSVAAGSTLIARSTDWTVPVDLQPTVQRAKALTAQVATDDQSAAALKGEESSAGLFGRIGVRHHEHQVQQDRGQASTQLRGLLLSIARLAPPSTFAEADQLRKDAFGLELQASQVEAQIGQAQASAKACEVEVSRRNDAIKAMGFDSLYEVAQLQTSGAQPVESPLVLKAGEQAYLAIPATLARMVTKTHYVGGSSGFSFPIGHTGIRYRTGSFRGEPIHQPSLSKLDTGTFVLTNQRVAYVGRTKSTSVPLSKVMHIEVYNDGLSVTREGTENPDFYLMANPKHAVFLLNWFLAKLSAS